MLKKIIVIFLVFLALLIIFLKFFIKEKTVEKKIIDENESYNSNLLENVEYISNDSQGNEYIIRANGGEIDFNNSDIIFLKDVTAIINLNNSDSIYIKSDFGKYNSSNYDTIFSKNVKINYLENEMTGEYLDFSLLQNRMIFSKNIVFINQENILKADVVEINIKTKDTKIFMYEKDKKVNIKNKNY